MLKPSFERISWLAQKPDGWKGPGSKAASGEVVSDTIAIVEKLADLCAGSKLPIIGLDEDGAFCLTWSDADLVGNLSVHGDGTYSFYIRRGTEVAAGYDEPVIGQLNEMLIKLIVV